MYANRVNIEDNSEDVRIGRVLHEIRAKDNKDTEIKYENIFLIIMKIIWEHFILKSL